jgi:hypothetical protein
MNLRFANLDGMPVRYTDREDWVFADGCWQ